MQKKEYEGFFGVCMQKKYYLCISTENVTMIISRNNLLLLFAFVNFIPLWACTSAVISGKSTPDGRPLLWKHRDTDFLRNHVAYVKGERYDFIADVNSATCLHPTEAWVGTNNAGFALMNTQSYNLVDVKPGEERGEANGRVIFRALEICATVEDFCHFLDTITKPSLIEANFGVIDAQGGAAMFEVDYYKYTMYDANEAPEGCIVRTNFSLSGQENIGGGYVRFMEAERVLMPAAKSKQITPQLIFNRLSRSYRNNQLGIDLREGICHSEESTGWFVDQDFIPRKSSSCSVVVQGVRKGEHAELTTMWTVLGYPSTGIAVPLWVKCGEKLPQVVVYDEDKQASPLSWKSLSLAQHVFAFHQGMGTEKYLYWKALYNEEETGYLQQIPMIEQQIFDAVCPVIESWRRKGKVNTRQLLNLYKDLDGVLTKAFFEMP